jgi:hypothetical protein
MRRRREMDSRNGKKFAEPRGWALKWVLAEAEAQAQVLAAEQQKSAPSGKKFAEPRSWAVKWDGTALSDAGNRQKD